MTACKQCGFKPATDSVRFCSRCGSKIAESARPAINRARELPIIDMGNLRRARPKTLVTLIASLLGLRQWLAEASDPLNSPILQVLRLSDEAKRVYIYLAGVKYSYGSCSSRLDTVARVTGASRAAARKAIAELERRDLLSHSTRNTWHGRGAYAYQIKRVR
jgi:hypothetical protein